mmetsp:Transcript_1526/g.3434  ORF Transcript_1526/g.3434 Transcript_1526/m.3434 type:complete len:96 (-) Transcript_1526:209-496(-)
MEDKVKQWAKSNKVEGDFAALCENEQVKKMMLDGLMETGKAAGLKGFEMVKALHLEPAAFDIERGLMTPTFKLKRPELQKYYQGKIDALYASLKK